MASSTVISAWWRTAAWGRTRRQRNGRCGIWARSTIVQKAIWRRTLQVFDESHQQYTTLSLFPEDPEIPAESSNSIEAKLSEMELRRPRDLIRSLRSAL